MTQFEFFGVAVSMILAIGISRLLDGVLPALQSPRRYWVHFLWIIQKLVNHIMWWWGLWAANAFEDWNLAWILWTLIGPIVLYLQATALVSTQPAEVESWEAHFFRIRRWFFLGNLVICANLLLGRFATPLTTLPSVTIGIAALAVLATIGIVTDNRRAHAVIVVMALSIQLLGLGAAMFNAGDY